MLYYIVYEKDYVILRKLFTNIFKSYKSIKYFPLNTIYIK